MALFGFQLVATMIAGLILQRLVPVLSFGRRFIRDRLLCYLPPTDVDLQAAGQAIHRNGAKPTKQKRQPPNPPPEFSIPKCADFPLNAAYITEKDLVSIPYYSDYQWTVDFTLCVTVVYLMCEIFFAVTLAQEMNLSMVWCIINLGFAVKILGSLVCLYFKVQDSGERVLCVTFGFLLFVVSMAVLVTPNKVLEFDLVEGYDEFINASKQFVSHQGLEVERPVTIFSYRFSLAVASGTIGALLTFPALRAARLYRDAQKYTGTWPLQRVLVHLNFAAPTLILLLWIFDTARLYIVLFFCLLRFFMLPMHLQGHFNTAYEKISALRQEAGKITNTALRTQISSVYHYSMVVALQYLLPAALLFSLSLMLKTMGGLSWCGNQVQLPTYWTEAANETSPYEDAMRERAKEFVTFVTDFRLLFSHLFIKSIISYFIWWCCCCLSITSAFGMYYYTNMTS